jgi:hypothetical protein
VLAYRTFSDIPARPPVARIVSNQRRIDIAGGRRIADSRQPDCRVPRLLQLEGPLTQNAFAEEFDDALED